MLRPPTAISRKTSVRPAGDRGDPSAPATAFVLQKAIVPAERDAAAEFSGAGLVRHELVGRELDRMLGFGDLDSNANCVSALRTWPQIGLCRNIGNGGRGEISAAAGISAQGRIADLQGTLPIDRRG